MTFLDKMATTNKIICCTWNCDTIKTRQLELSCFLDNFNIDICCLNETRLDKGLKLKCTGYNVHRSDRNSQGGGVAILVKSNIKHEKNYTVNNISTENLVVDIDTDNGKVTIVAVYNPPNKTLSAHDLNVLFRLNNKVLIVGDFNAKHIAWNCFTNNKNGNILLSYINKNNIILNASDEPTHYPTNPNFRPSVIDMVLSKNVQVSKPKTLSQLSSNHNPVVFEINKNTHNLPIRKVHNYQKADFTKFNEYITNNIHDARPIINNNIELEHQFVHFIKLIKKAIKNSVPKETTEHYKNKVPNEILKLIHIKNKFRKIAQKYRNAKNVTQYKIAQNIVNNKLNEWRNNNWNKTLSKLTPQRGNLWKIKKIFTKTCTNIPPLVKQPNQIAYSDQDKAELLADNFENIHNSTLSMGSKHHTYKIEKAVKTFIQQTIIRETDIDKVTTDEVYGYIKKLKNKKAPGIDGIPNVMIKKIPQIGIELLTYLINKTLELSYYPNIFKHAKLIPIPKPGKPTDLPINYRPISLLSSLNKLIEKVIKNRLDQHIEEHNILRNEQFGFRNYHSTIAQLARICDNATDAFNLNKYTGLALFDIEKAFDTMWQNGLIYKLIEYKFPKYLIKLIHFYLLNRTFSVHINDIHSTIRLIKASVPQGSVLGPILYILYINDFPKFDKTDLALFADDSAIYTNSWRTDTIANRLTKAAKKINNHFSKWKIKLNSQKTEAILLTKRRPQITPKAKVNNIDIEWSETVKYLGVMLDKKLNFTTHIKYVAGKAVQAMCQLYPLFNKYCKLSNNNKMLIYKVCIRPIFTYAAPVWSNTSVANIKTLQLIQNRCLRIIGKYPRWKKISEMHSELDILYVKDFILKLSQKFFENCSYNANELIKSIGNYEINDFTYKKYKHKRTKHILL